MAPGTPGAGGGFLGLSADPRGCEVSAIGLEGGGGVGEASNLSSGAQTLLPLPL